MHIILILLLLSTLILVNVKGATSFDTQAYALAHPCVWSICKNAPTEYQNYSIDCCTLQVPLNYAKPNQSFISISMSRLHSSYIRSNNTLFVITGGPGESGWSIFQTIADIIPVTYGITLIFPDHRGTGLSTLLNCDDQFSQTVTLNCISYLTNRWTIEGLNQFSITSAVHDLSIQIQAYQSNDRLAILSFSYGTLWLDRFLQIYPNLVQASIMDSPFNPLLQSMSLYNTRAAYVVAQFLTYCQIQTECIQYFPNDPPAVMLHKILHDLDLNKQICINTYFSQYKINSNKMRSTLFFLFQSALRYFDRTIIPAFIFRLNRCNQEDVDALDFFFQTQGFSTSSSNNMSSNDENLALLNSNVLFSNIVFSELWLSLNQSAIDQETLNALYNATIMSREDSSDVIALRSAWPKYSLDEYRYRVANSSLLMISGQLDPATPFDLASHLATIMIKTRKLYSIPLVGHVITPIASLGYSCPLQIILSWAFPALFQSERSDPACIQDLPTSIDFIGATEMGRQTSLTLFNLTLPFGTSQQANNATADCSTLSNSLSNYMIYIHILFFFSFFFKVIM
ncbi:unnamed protein product [Rotaria sp. Silwood1]|nr:unnamed protein product [Rotaria sp. Silwood1]